MKKYVSARFLNLLALVSLLSLVSAQSADAAQVLRTLISATVAALKPMGRLPGTNRLDLAISLPWRNAGELGRLLQEISDPASPNFRHYLTTAQFTQQFGPSEKDYEAVMAFAKTHGLKVGGTHLNRMLLDVSGAVTDIEQAFHVKMQVYQHPAEARTFYAPDSGPSLDLATPVLEVNGLDNYAVPHPCLKPMALDQAKPGLTGSGPGGSYLGNDFRAAYVPGVTLTGTGQTVGLLEFDSGYDQSDITAYETRAGLSNVPVSAVLLDGYGGGLGEASDEVSLDIEMAISMAPGLKGVLVYEGSATDDILNRMATDNLAKQIGASWTYPIDATSDQIFQQMAAQGQTFFNASGDSDAYTGAVPTPSDDTNITVVGGTTLTTTGPGGAWVSETVWNWGNGIGSSGGISTRYPIPSWQTNINMTANHGSTTMRNLPDVALTGDNVYVAYGGGQAGSFGGTSCATPLWAAFTALVNQQAVMSGRPTVGFINPAIDTIASGQNYPLCFHDITTGNNTWSGSPGNFYAVAGYDLCTGWGVPAGQNLINALATPDPLIIQPDTGFASVGASGGPFTLASESFVLTNIGTNGLTWVVATNSTWLSISPGGGTLASHGPAMTVNVSLSAGAYSLPIGDYTAAVAFSNLTTGFAQTRQFTLQVVPSVPPTIVTQPTNQSIYVGFDAGFSVTISGTPPLTYQWQFDTSNINGATNATLTLTNVAYSQAGSYSVVVSNTFGSTNSSNAMLTVNPPPPCAPVPPGLVSWWPGDGDTLDIGGTNNGTAEGSLTYAAGEVGQAFKFDGSSAYVACPASASLNVGAGSGLTFECWINPASISASASLVEWDSASSLGAEMVLSAGPLNSPAVPGTLFANLIDTANNYHSFLTAGGVVGANTFQHVALTYDKASGIGTLYCNGAVAATTNLGVFTPQTSYSFYLGHRPNAPDYYNGLMDEASLYDRALSSNEIQSIYEAGSQGKCSGPVIFVQPLSQTVTNGNTVSFTVSAYGTAPLVYQWLFNNTNLADNGQITGSRSNTLTLTDVQITNSGTYAVLISNLDGSIMSSNAVLAVGYAPVITNQPQSDEVAQGTNVLFVVGVNGTGPLNYQWYFDGVSLPQHTNSTLALSNVQLANTGSYDVGVSSPFGAVLSSNATLTVDVAPTILSQPTNQTLYQSFTATFNVGAAGSLPLAYQWQFDTSNHYCPGIEWGGRGNVQCL